MVAPTTLRGETNNLDVNNMTRASKNTSTPFFRLIVSLGGSQKGVAFGILWNGCVVRVNVATLKGVAFVISRTVTMRLDLTEGCLFDARCSSALASSTRVAETSDCRNSQRALSLRRVTTLLAPAATLPLAESLAQRAVSGVSFYSASGARAFLASCTTRWPVS